VLPLAAVQISGGWARPAMERVNNTATGAEAVPQFVSISIDDAMHEPNGALTDKVPNVKWTFFVNVLNQRGGWSYDPALADVDCIDRNGQDTGNPGCLTKADVVRAKYAAGHEIALHTYTHPALASGEHILDQADVTKEIRKNFEYLVACGVKPSDITGFRAPYLDTQSWGPGEVQNAKNDALRRLQEVFNDLEILYDSTFTAQPEFSRPRRGVRHCSDHEGGWKYRACGYDERQQYAWEPDRGGYPAFTEASNPAPTWHWFMNEYTWRGERLSSMDQVNTLCREVTCTVEMVKAVYMENFEKHYHGARAPFGIFLHGVSLINEVEVAGLNAFLDEVRQLPDVQLATQGEVARYYRENGYPSY